jgi:hypothetical protein
MEMGFKYQTTSRFYWLISVGPLPLLVQAVFSHAPKAEDILG